MQTDPLLGLTHTQPGPLGHFRWVCLGFSWVPLSAEKCPRTPLSGVGQALPGILPTSVSPQAGRGYQFEEEPGQSPDILSVSSRFGATVSCSFWKWADFALPLGCALGTFFVNKNEIYQIAFLTGMNPMCMYPSQRRGGEKLNFHHTWMNGYNFPRKIKIEQAFTSLGKCLVTLECTYLWNQRYFGVLWSQLATGAPPSRTQITECPIARNPTSPSQWIQRALWFGI